MGTVTQIDESLSTVECLRTLADMIENGDIDHDPHELVVIIMNDGVVTAGPCPTQQLPYRVMWSLAWAKDYILHPDL
jgi:hypothetical protein